ncbi:electron transfer flavoprotein subunit alpha/FixB family protein, partial [Intestinimonas butyriciproducens]|nr:electron transfer flavoprotein subunit alpha/FixB family protein [Intestinimonas butyriciproducens]
ELYLACGISGAFQHVTGMEESQLIIAINKNPAAPIFDISDLGIVGNVEVLLPRLIAALK